MISKYYSGLLTDFYQLSMLQGYFYKSNERQAVFDVFFRRPPFKSGFSVFAGLDTLLEIIENFRFSESDIDYLDKLNFFKDDFLDYLKEFKFKGDIYSVLEGSIVFPSEPVLKVKANILEAQLIETIILNILNFQTLVATKSARMKIASKGKSILEFGMRRAQGVDGAISASRAAFIGGADATSNVLAGKVFNIPVKGTMAHSWVMSFDSELKAFEAFAEIYPKSCVLLIDTYDTLGSGLNNAIKVLLKLKKNGYSGYGVRIDSGDLAFLSIKARQILDEAGLEDAIIIASNELDEWVIKNLIEEGAQIDSFGVGTRLVTGGEDSALSGVYKLSSYSIGDKKVDCMKVTNNLSKMTDPGDKNYLRFYDKEGKAICDLIYLIENETDLIYKINNKEEIRFNHPSIEYANFILKNYDMAEIMLKKVMSKGKKLNNNRRLEELQDFTKAELTKFDSTYLRLLNPHIYKVSISDKLKKLKSELIAKAK
jgi:nicotinate phosphoribosyltransferase